VYAAVWRGKEVAVKRLSPGIGHDSEQYRALVREVELSSKFNSERLVRVYGACLKVGVQHNQMLLACVWCIAAVNASSGAWYAVQVCLLKKTRLC